MRKGAGGYIEPLAPDGGSLEGGCRPASSAIVSTPSYHSSRGAKHPHPCLLMRPIHLDRGYAGCCKGTSENSSLPLCVVVQVHILDDAQGGRGWLENFSPGDGCGRIAPRPLM